MRKTSLRLLALGFVLLLSLAVFGVWKIGELVFAGLPAQLQYRVLRSRSQILQPVRLGGGMGEQVAQVAGLDELQEANAVYGIPLRLPESEAAETDRPPGAVFRDYYLCALPGAQPVTRESIWKLTWSLMGGRAAQRDDAGDVLRISNVTEPNVQLQSLAMRVPPGERFAVRLRGRAETTTKIELRSRHPDEKPDGGLPIELDNVVREWVVSAPPRDTERTLFWEILFREGAGPVEFAALDVGTATFQPSLPRFGTHYIERRLDERGDREAARGEVARNGVRIVCLGDSFTEGVGVREDETFPRQLESRLSEAGEIVTVRNAGRMYADPSEYLRHFQTRELDFDSDVVVVALCRNDFHTPELLEQWQKQFSSDPAGEARAQREYCLTQGFSAAFEYLAKLDVLCEERKAELIICAYQTDSSPESFRLDGDARSFAETRGLLYLNPAFALSAAGAFDHLSFCGMCEHHPSANVHRVFAEELANLLGQSGALERARKRASNRAAEAR